MDSRCSYRPTALEFFAGSGLVSYAIKRHFKVVWANDNCDKKAAVYTANHGNKRFVLDSIENIRGRKLPYADMSWASFPCQDLSLAGLNAGITGQRSGLVWEWLRVIDEMPKKPPLLVAENVEGLVSREAGGYYRLLHQELIARNYLVGAMLLDAERWIPQSRPRIFIVAVRNDFMLPKEYTTKEPNWLHTKSIQKAALGLENWVWWSMPEPKRRTKTIEDIIEWDAPYDDIKVIQRNLDLLSTRHFERLHRERTRVAPGYKRTRNGTQVLEIRFDGVAGCLRTPEGGSSRQLLVLLNEQGEYRTRLLTVRETARLMGAPDSYKLPGTYNEGYKAMGDAVAVPVARYLANNLLHPLAVAYHEQNSKVGDPYIERITI
ncbi:DNA (cytosine-5-)-methyltransferase [Paenibacillus elgii]|uniref:DNA (cytosine-5-)-methyltransferase n=1 Tax=Paenibacillus elgii TaxID=189691 RepID=A0A2T6FS37_9BACL|nr:DNA (cytosine-5-)-methyltransferase [Paenibacillus elgii]PUA34706.1 DNA (cytosine-5-)-methyltransferase [Paenibacillus elgii]